ncbi:MAG TPA: HAD-IA family hydrolase, partial [Acidimicrobiales bacterium]
VLPGARQLVHALSEAGLAVVLASSAPRDHLDRFREILDVEDHLAGATSADDVDASKPEPDVFNLALDRFDLERGGSLAIGDTIWDARAAQRAHLVFAAVRTGGADADVLRREGAVKVYADAADLVGDLEDGPLSPFLALAQRTS